MLKISKVLMAILAAVIMLSFFLPWVNIESGVVGGVSKLLTGERKATLQSISGFQVPILANRPDSQLIMSIIQLFNPGVKDADKKSWLIWGVPGLAVLMAMVFWFLEKNKWVSLGFGIVGVLIFAVATFKILTTNLDKLVMRVTIGYGLWLLLVGYLGIGLVCLGNFIPLLKGKK